MQQTDLLAYNNYPYDPEAPKNSFKRILWYLINAIDFLRRAYYHFMVYKNGFIKVVWRENWQRGGDQAVCTNIKYPWFLTIGNEVWIGENVWIDCLVPISIGNNVCLSQGAVLLTGSHNYKKRSFDLITGSVILEDGVWIGAGAIVNQGVVVASHAVLTAGSVATKNLDAYSIYQGNPAVKIRERVVE